MAADLGDSRVRLNSASSHLRRFNKRQIARSKARLPVPAEARGPRTTSVLRARSQDKTTQRKARSAAVLLAGLCLATNVWRVCAAWDAPGREYTLFGIA